MSGAQKKLRIDTIKRYPNGCPISYIPYRTCEAAHIVGVAEIDSSKIDNFHLYSPQNAFLLNRNYDYTFDKHFYFNYDSDLHLLSDVVLLLDRQSIDSRCNNGSKETQRLNYLVTTYNKILIDNPDKLTRLFANTDLNVSLISLCVVIFFLIFDNISFLLY